MKGRRTIRGIEGGVQTNIRGIDTCRTMLPAHSGGADGQKAPTTNYRFIAADHRPTDEQFAPRKCDHNKIKQWIQTLTNERDEAMRSPAAPVTNEDLRQELPDMTQHPEQSGEEDNSLRTQVVNVLTLAARAVLAAPPAP
jgi:hypothetical protein